MKIPVYQVDAFTDKPFSGNPAAVCPLEAWLAVTAEADSDEHDFVSRFSSLQQV